MSNEIDAKKFVWAYMLENGIETTGEWNYYGGSFDAADPALQYDYEKQQGARTALLARVRQVGIDWLRTEMPESSRNSEFNGTFAESSNVETLLGNLLLKDSSAIKIGCNDEGTRFGNYVRRLAELAADKDRVKRILGE